MCCSVLRGRCVGGACVCVCVCVCVCSMCFLLWLTASGRAPPGRQGSADFEGLGDDGPP